jgi:glycerol-3-phosphate dehydrogenase (NAD(P)+)
MSGSSSTVSNPRVTVVGAGAWGTTVASVLAARAEVTLWAREPEVAQAITERHENPVFLPGLTVDAALTSTDDVEAALAGAEAVLMAVPAQHFRSVLTAAQPFIEPRVPFLTLAKGIEEGSLLRMTEVAAEVLAGHDADLIGALSGPNIAREVLAGQPAATVVALRDAPAARAIQHLLTSPSLRVYTNSDVVGCEIGGAVKNVLALAAGMAAGLGFGDNTLAALITRGLAELTRLGVALGGQPLTFLGLAGVGDLIVTCHSPGSRNHHVGEELGRGRPLADIVSEMRSVAEGVRSCGPVLALGRRAGIELPICEQVGEVLDGRTRPREALDTLLHRDATSELHGIE